MLAACEEDRDPGKSCPPTQVSSGGRCVDLCRNDDTCDAGKCCTASGSCVTCAPDIHTVDSRGSDDGAPGHAAKHLGRELVIKGDNLSGVKVSLIGKSGGPNHEDLVPAGPDTRDTRTEVTVLLPASLAEGAYALRVVNAGGEDQADVTILQGEPGTACDLDDSTAGQVLITCGDDTAALLDGRNGDRGPPGAACTLGDKVAGKVALTCGADTVQINDGTLASSIEASFSRALSGTVQVLSGFSVVNGIGTAFTTEVEVGDAIQIGAETFIVTAITDDDEMTISTPVGRTYDGVTAYAHSDLFTVTDGAAQRRLTVDSSGNMALGGNAAPISRGFPLGKSLTVASDTHHAFLELAANIPSGGDGGGAVFFTNRLVESVDKRIAQITGRSLDGGQTGMLKFITWNAGQAVSGLTLFPNGSVGIGTGNTQARGNLEVKTGTAGEGFIVDFSNDPSDVQNVGTRVRNQSDVSSNGNFIFEMSGGSDVNGGFLFRTGRTEVANRLKITHDGNVGIGTPAPQALLHVAGTGLCDGGCTASSRTKKDRIRDLTVDEAESALLALRPTRFVYKHSGEEEVGFIAEDVPELVAKKGRQGLDAMDIAAVLTKVVQEQREELRVQGERLDAALRRLSLIEAR